MFIYCGNDPLNRIDTSGADSIDMIGGDKEDEPELEGGAPGNGKPSGGIVGTNCGGTATFKVQGYNYAGNSSRGTKGIYYRVRIAIVSICIGETIMNWNEFVLNRKGFIHHPETPEQDRVAYSQNRIKAQQLLQIGMDFIKSNGALSHRSIPQGKELLGTKSKFLHRGVFCPSPVLDILIANSKRGRILVRPTKRSNITNKYVYDESDRLIWVDNYIDNRIVSSEYLLYQADAIYGITIGETTGKLLSVSEELYANNRIENYSCAYYSGEDCEMRCYQMHIESYHYEECGLAGWDYYEIYYSMERIAASGLVRHNRYRLKQEDGWLKGFMRVNIDGTTIEGAEYTEINIERKA